MRDVAVKRKLRDQLRGYTLRIDEMTGHWDELGDKYPMQADIGINM